MKTRHLLLAITATVILFCESCTNKHFINSWKCVEATRNGQPIPQDIGGTVEFKSDGSFIYTSVEGFPGTGTWQLANDNQDIVLSEPGFCQTWHIIESKSDNLLIFINGRIMAYTLSTTATNYHFVLR